MRILEIDAPVNRKWTIITGNLNVFRAWVKNLRPAEEKSLLWILTLCHDILRKDYRCYGLFEEVLENVESAISRECDEALESLL